MSFYFSVNGKQCAFEGTLSKYDVGELSVYTRDVASEFAQGFAEAYKRNDLKTFLDERTEHRFLAALFDTSTGSFVMANDKFGSNEIYYVIRDGKLEVGESLSKLVAGTPGVDDLDPTAVYELLSFYTIMPPRTIFKGISALPMASVMEHMEGKGVPTMTRYWDVERRLSKKVDNYDAHVATVREEFLKAIEKELGAGFGVSLSGGSDSGAILGMATALAKRPIPSVTLGGRGPKTLDLESSRKTAEEQHSPNYEIYPSFTDLRKLPEFVRGYSQPINGDLVFANSLLFEEAKKRGVDKLAFGFGAEMLLGNLKISRVASKMLWVEWLPREMRNILYKMIAAAGRYSQNQTEFLLARSWGERFLHVRGTLRTREEHLFTKLPQSFSKDFVSLLNAFVHKGIRLFDSFVMMYVFTWTNYLQLRDFYAMARSYGIRPFSPFDVPRVAEVLLGTPTKFRKRNKWNKQVLRDMYRPYLTDRLYQGPVRSLIIPYSELFKGKQVPLIRYLKTSVVRHFIDLDAYERTYASLPEPGLNLMRLLSLAVWYDTNWNPGNLANFEKAEREAEQI